ncbi:hypothetical protein [Pararhizobium qamdonense]|uniref:hypothetical protein n=1 Tax=Pararhizobium qamdonense TaxID=3031126 RepID=UPI0023E1761A|nr:hypothetical protein [Pararhizobium qamdonense]
MPSITLNKETIGFVMGIVALMTAIFGGYNWLLSGRPENSPVVKEIEIKNFEQDQRLDRTDRDRERSTAATKELTSKTDELKEAVVRLTTVLEQGGPLTKKAEYESLLPSVNRQAIKFEVQ